MVNQYRASKSMWVKRYFREILPLFLTLGAYVRWVREVSWDVTVLFVATGIIVGAVLYYFLARISLRDRGDD